MNGEEAIVEICPGWSKKENRMWICGPWWIRRQRRQDRAMQSGVRLAGQQASKPLPERLPTAAVGPDATDGSTTGTRCRGVAFGVLRTLQRGRWHGTDGILAGLAHGTREAAAQATRHRDLGIAERVGYSSVRTFGVAFTRQRGHSAAPLRQAGSGGCNGLSNRGIRGQTGVRTRNTLSLRPSHAPVEKLRKQPRTKKPRLAGL